MAVHPFNEFNLDPALAEAVAGVEPNFLIEGILRLDDPGEIPLEFGVVCRFDRIFTGRFRAADAWTIRRNPNVASLKAARPIGTPELERLLDAGSELPQRAVPPYTGRGSVVAALDFGLDFAHPNFRNADGSTRVLAFWNQGAGYDISHPNSYGYGRVFSREEINEALEAEDPYGALGYHPSISDTGDGSHGTHTLDIAAGNGRVGAASAAAEADILFVHLSTPRLDAAGNLGDSVRLLEGLDFVRRAAGDRPWVVNLSVGRTAGSKDGTSLVEQGMHECLRMGNGRAIAQSAGNYRSANLTVEGSVQEGESRELLWIIQPDDPTPNELDIWYSAKDRLSIEIQPPHSTESIRVALGRMEEILYDGNVIGRIYHRKNDPNNGDNHCEIFLRTAAPAGTWIGRLVGEYVISGRFHAWIERDIGRAGAQSRFAPEIVSERYTLGTIATSPLVITVGAYDAYDPTMPSASFSSLGPTRDERLYKPELLAPGVSVVAARSIPRGETHQEGLTVARSGTSMAAPHVTGVIAAMYEAAGRRLSIDEIREYLRLSAVPLDAEEHGAYWGRLNATEAIRLARGEPVVEAVTDFAPEEDYGRGRALPVSTNEASAEAGVETREAFMDGIAEDLVLRAELALDRNAGDRRQSEILFLRKLLDLLGWQSAGTVLSPAKLFRLAAGEDAGIGAVLKVIGAPSKRTMVTLRRGDWMIRLAPATGDVGHVSVLASDDLMSRSRIRNEEIPAESSLPGYYGTVIEGGVYPHDRSIPFARRFLDGSGRVPQHSFILRPTLGKPEDMGAEDIKADASASVPTNANRVKELNEYNPANSDKLVINTVEFDTGIAGITNYRSWKTNSAVHHNRFTGAYRDPFSIKHLILHETSSDSGDGFDPTVHYANGQPYLTVSHLAVTRNAKILQFNDLVETENHTVGLNTTSIGIEFVNRDWLSSKQTQEGIPSTPASLSKEQKKKYAEENGYLWAFWGDGFNIYRVPPSLDQLEKEVDLVRWLTMDLPGTLQGMRGISIYNLFPSVEDRWLQLISYNEIKGIWTIKADNLPPAAEQADRNLFVMTTGYGYLTPEKIVNKSGIISHNATYEDHPDGSFLALYTWLRLKKSKTKDEAYELCRTLMKEHFIKARPKSHPAKQIVILDVRDANLNVRPVAGESADPEYEAGRVSWEREHPLESPAGRYSREKAEMPVPGFEPALNEEIGKFGAAEEQAEFDIKTGTAEPIEDDFSDEMSAWWPKQQTDISEDAPPVLSELPPFRHFFQPMKPSPDGKSWIPDGVERALESLNPGFIGSNDDLVTGPTQTPLVDLLTGTTAFKRYLTNDSIRTRSARAGDKIRVAIVDLTGAKLTKPEFAGWGSTVALEAASSGKVVALLAAYQLLNDLRHVAATDGIKTVNNLIAEMDKRWKSIPRGSRPRLSTFLDGSSDPPDLKFSEAIETSVANIINNDHHDPNNANHSASVLLHEVGFPYAASATWQSGLYHSKRRGLWLVNGFEKGGPSWSDPVRPPGAGFGHTGTALSLATFFTLLAQRRLVTPESSAEMRRRLSTASFFESSYWPATPIGSAAIASKVGLLLKCVDSRCISTHAHEPALIENGKYRYVVALMTVGIDNGVEVLQSLLGEIDKLIRAQNP